MLTTILGCISVVRRADANVFGQYLWGKAFNNNWRVSTRLHPGPCCRTIDTTIRYGVSVPSLVANVETLNGTRHE